MSSSTEKEEMKPLKHRQIVEWWQDVARMIFAIWTSQGADESTLAPALLDGHVEALGLYCTFRDDDDDDLRELLEQTYANIDHVHCWELTYEDLFLKYMLFNRPVII